MLKDLIVGKRDNIGTLEDLKIALDLLELMDFSEEDMNFDFSQENKKYETDKDTLIYEINGPFFFGAADKFLDQINGLGEHNKTIIIGMKHVNFIDATALHAFKRMLNTCEKHHIVVYVTGIQQGPYQTLEKASLTDRIGVDHFLKSIDDAKKKLQS